MRKIFVLLTLLVVATTVSNAEKIKTYTMKMPSYVFDGVKTVFVKNIIVEDSEPWNVRTGGTVTELIKKNIKDAQLGAQGGYTITLPWMSTQLYQLVNSEGEADLVISGTIRSSLTKNDESGMKGKYYTATHKLPYMVKKYSRNKDADASIDLQFTNKSGVALKVYSKMNMTYHYSKEYLGAPKLTKDGDFEGEIPDRELTMNCISDYLKSIKADLTPKLITKEYDVKKVKKVKDKSLSKKQKEAYKLTKKENYTAAADLFAEVADNAADKRAVLMASKNTGILYMITGNFEKSEVYLKKSGDNKLITELTKLKDLYQQLQDLGRL